MLFVLSGNVQTGKTRWLTRLADHLENNGIAVHGVLAPGIWECSGDPENDAVLFEKCGIDNILLPQKERISFALHRDIALRQKKYVPQSQSASAKILWQIDDRAIERVNRHFDVLAQRAAIKPGKPGILVIDELGQLELKRSQGLSSAISLVEEGPTLAYEHVLIVVRERLYDIARERFESSWSDIVLIGPDPQGWMQVNEAYGLRG